MPSGNRKKYFRGYLFGSLLSQFEIYQPSGNLKLNNLGIFQSLKFRILMEKILLISLKLNFSSNSLGCCGLIWMFASSAEARVASASLRSYTHAARLPASPALALSLTGICRTLLGLLSRIKVCSPWFAAPRQAAGDVV